MKKHFYIKCSLLLGISLGCLHSFSQQVPKIYRAYAFAQLQLPGNAPADSSDFATNKFYFGYIELNSKEKPLVSKAWINKETYNVIIADLDTTSVAIKNNSGKTTELKADKGKKIWLLEMSPAEKQKTMPASYSKLKAGTVLLELLYQKKSFYYTISPVIELKPNPRNTL